MPGVRVEGFGELSPVGRGGLGDVYRACRLSTGGLVALKILRDASEDVVSRRIGRELEALLQLKGHPYVIQIEEVVSTPQGPAIVMEYAELGSVAQLAASGAPLSVADTILVAEHVGVALRDAHAKGIVHRDIKPSNLLIGSFGQVKVCDFGIASLLQDPTFSDRTNAISARYASPEELDESGDIGPASDMYSLSVTLMHLLTGRPPSMADRMRLTQGDRPAIADPVDPRVAADLLDVLVSCLDLEASGRPTARNFVDRVQRLAGQLAHHRSHRLSACESPEPDVPDDVTIRRSVATASSVDSPVGALPAIGDAPPSWWA